MPNLFIFLFIAFVSRYFIKSTSTSRIWIKAVLIPFVSLIAYILTVSFVEGPYVGGQVFVSSVLPAIISGFIIYFQIKRKTQNKDLVYHTIILLIFMVLSLIYTIYQHIMETSYRNALLEYINNTY